MTVWQDISPSDANQVKVIYTGGVSVTQHWTDHLKTRDKKIDKSTYRIDKQLNLNTFSRIWIW